MYILPKQDFTYVAIVTFKWQLQTSRILLLILIS